MAYLPRITDTSSVPLFPGYCLIDSLLAAEFRDLSNGENPSALPKIFALPVRDLSTHRNVNAFCLKRGVALLSSRSKLPSSCFV